MKGMKGMKAAMKSSYPVYWTTSGVYRAVAKSAGLKPKDVKAAVEGALRLAAKQAARHDKFCVDGKLQFKLHVKLPQIERMGKPYGTHPKTKAPCVVQISLWAFHKP